MSQARYQPVPVADDDHSRVASVPFSPQTYDPRVYYSAQGVAVPQLYSAPPAAMPMAALSHSHILPAPPSQPQPQPHQPQPQPQPQTVAVPVMPPTAVAPLDESRPFHVEPAHTSPCMKLMLFLTIAVFVVSMGVCAFLLFYAPLDDVPSRSREPPTIPSQPPSPPMSSAFLLHDLAHHEAPTGDQESGGESSSAEVEVNVASSRVFLTLALVYMGAFLIIIPLVYLIKWPKRLELYPTTLVMHTYLASHSVAYTRVEYAELHPSVLCRASNMNSVCRQPRGMYTSFSNGMLFASADCGQTLLFTPQDPSRLIAQLRRTTLANRLIVPPR